MNATSSDSKLVHLQRSISSLSVDCLDTILSYSGHNAAAYLILTGNSTIISKVRRTGTLSVRWESTAYFDWNTCKSLIESFQHLRSLHLTTWSPQLLGREYLKATLFPPTLTSLELDFYDVFRILDTDHWCGLFNNVLNLESLTISSPNEYHTIYFEEFPKTLRSLRLLAPHYTSISSGTPRTVYLPPNLETLHLLARPSSRFIELLEHEFCGRIPGHLESLTDLSLRLSVGDKLDLSSIASRLRHLEVMHGDVFVNSVQALYNAPTRKLFPRLESLKTNNCAIVDWIQLKSLPPTLTHLRVPFGDSERESQTAIGPLNAASNDHELPTHALPRNLRHVEMLKLSKVKHCFMPPEIICHFTALVSPCYTFSNCMQDILNLPNTLTSLSLNVVQLSWLKLLPPSLQSLKIVDLSIPDDTCLLYSGHPPSAPVSSERPPEILRGLTALRITGRNFPLPLIPLLPLSLISLTIYAGETHALIALARHQRNGLLPELKSLRVKGARGPYNSHAQIELSMDSIPPLIRTLSLRGDICFPKDPSQSLCHHSLTSLMIPQPMDPLELLEHLPSSLRLLKTEFSRALDLADPEQALELYLLGFQRNLHLRELHLRGIPYLEPWCWKTPARSELTSRLASWLKLPMPLKMIYIRSIWHWIWIQHEQFNREDGPKHLASLIASLASQEDYLPWKSSKSCHIGAFPIVYPSFWRPSSTKSRCLVFCSSIIKTSD